MVDQKWNGKSPLRPGILEIFGEFRAVGEAASLCLSFISNSWPWPQSQAGSKRILFIPGFLAGDLTLEPLASFCTWLGHHSEFAGIWLNAQCPRLMLQRLEAKLLQAYCEAGSQVVLIGHSLGGVYARALAGLKPQAVERVITLGAPVIGIFHSSHHAIGTVARSLGRLTDQEGCLAPSCQCGVSLERAVPESVPVTAIYSRTDGIVHWSSCLSTADNVEHLEVVGSHIGLTVNCHVFEIVANRLAMPNANVRRLTNGKATHI